MSIPLNTLTSSISTISDIASARRWVDSFPRPMGFSPYAWNTTKKIAIEVWKCFFAGRKFDRTLNFMHPSFYMMIKTPEGASILMEKSIRGMC
jgi:hypothetical protein